MPPQEKTCVLFGCGYLGRRVAAEWRRRGHSVVAVTRSAERAEQLSLDGLIPYVGDVCAPNSLDRLPDADCVLWAVGFDRTSGRTQREVFVEGLSHVLNRIGLRCRRFLYISSTGVYGQQDGTLVDETSPCEPATPGGICCLEGERLVRAQFSGRTDSDAVTLRLAGIYGPQRLLSRVAELQAGTPLAGRAEAWLNLIHVDDAAAAVVAAGNVPQPSPVILIADDRPVRRSEYYTRLAQLAGAPPPQFDEAQLRSRGSGGLNKRCNNQMMKRELAFSLRYPTFETGLPAAWHGGG